MRGMDNLVILSPHFDDGVLSCGGRIWQVRQQGGAVRVVTLFAGAARGEVPPFALVQHRMWGDPPDANRLRRAEDVAAYARLGCFDVYYLDAPDAVYRKDESGRALYDSTRAIFGPLHPADSGAARILADFVRAYLPPEAAILAPLGVGHHVDHQLGHAVGRLLLEEGWHVAFYEELPYIEQPGGLDEALADKMGWRVSALPLPEAALAAKVAAMAYYRSQVPVLYRDDLSMSRRIRAVANAVTPDGLGYAERLWESGA